MQLYSDVLFLPLVFQFSGSTKHGRVANKTFRQLFACLSLISLFYFLIWHSNLCFPETDPDLGKDMVALVSSKGYPIENYTVRTEDGYLLEIFRIPHGISGEAKWNTSSNARVALRPAVLVTHSLSGRPEMWVFNMPSQSLGFVLAEAGYDVWLACARGCYYSRRHINLSRNTQEFWEFSWEEQGRWDLPVMVDFVLKVTGQEKLFLIGNSMGTTMSFVFLSTRPEYNDKIRAMLMISPIANISLKGMNSPTSSRTWLYTLGRKIFNGEILTGGSLNKILTTICSVPVIRNTFCLAIANPNSSRSLDQINVSRIPVYASYYPDGFSIKQVQHFDQVISAKQFVRFDYGTEKNLQLYQQANPPQFPIEKISAPVALYWSLEDDLFGFFIPSLIRRIVRLVDNYRIPFSPWNHDDFVSAIQAKKYVYDRMLYIMSKY